MPVGRNAKLINPLSLDRQRLAASFYGRALAIAATEGRGLPSYAHDDVRSAAGWGCVFAAAEWCEARGPWEAFAYVRVRSKILDVIRSIRRRLDRHLAWTWQSEKSALWWW
jgi:hypothetical protein